MHSVVIPHRARELHLELCLWALARSARACGVTDWEAVVADDPVRGEWFNKSRALNAGIDRAQGDVLTFLDADAIVGVRFMEAAPTLRDASLDRICYRVRYLPSCEALRIVTAEDREVYVRELFAEYDAHRLAVECVGTHWIDRRKRPGATGEPWGNSQFSITREKLGDLRYDEEIGWAMEDIDMNMQLEARFGRSYRGGIFTDADHAMFHVEHPPSPWRDRDFLSQRMRMHRLKRKKLLGY